LFIVILLQWLNTKANFEILEQKIPLTKASLLRTLAAWIYYVIAPHKGKPLMADPDLVFANQISLFH